MLTAIGRAAARRLVAHGPTTLVVRSTSSSPTCLLTKIAASPATKSRAFTTSPWVAASADESSTTRTKRASTKKAGSSASGTTKKKSQTATKAKPKKKKAAAKPKPKPKPKPKKKPVEKTPEQKLRDQIREKKRVALLKEPKKQPETAWTIFTSQNINSGERNLGERMKVLCDEYRSLSSSEHQGLQDTAEKNKLSNNAAYKAWVESHPPEVIYDANYARAFLRRKLPTNQRAARRPAIRDDRQPKRAQTAYILYVKSRWANDNFHNIPAGQAMQQISQDFKALSSSERQTYEDLAAAETERYAKEMKSVLNKDVKRSTSPSSSSS